MEVVVDVVVVDAGTGDQNGAVNPVATIIRAMTQKAASLIPKRMTRIELGVAIKAQ